MSSRAHRHRAGGAAESIGALLTRLRLARGYSQLRLAERLCAVAAMSTVSRHEVSRWEREERVPGSFWLGWLAVVLDTPLDTLEAAVAVTRRTSPTAGRRPPEHRRLWRMPTADELLLALDRADGSDLRDLAHTWLAGPPDPLPADPGAGPGPQVWRTPAALDRLDARLGELRRMDDLMGGVDLARHVDRELRAAVSALRAAGGAGPRRRAIRLVAELAQLAGWVRADAGDPAGARRTYRVALHAAAAAGDKPLAAHVLGALSHQCLAAGDPHEALLLARSGHAGASDDASAYTRALLLHRVALAAAHAGERRAAHSALAAAERVADRSEPDREPAWLYWLDPAELSAMTGRCLVVLGRPLRAARLLARPRSGTGPRTAALYAAWLGRSYLELGEVELACRVAMRALGDAVRAGSTRAVTGLRHLHAQLLRHRDVPAVRGYERLAASAAGYLPAPGLPTAGRPAKGFPATGLPAAGFPAAGPVGSDPGTGSAAGGARRSDPPPADSVAV